MKKPHNQDLCSMCQKLGRKCTGLVEEDVSDEEKNKLDEPNHRVIQKDGVKFKIRGSLRGRGVGFGESGGGSFGGGNSVGGGFGGNGGGDGTPDDRKNSKGGAFLFINGLPLDVPKEYLQEFLSDAIPEAEVIRVHHGIGEYRVWIRLEAGSIVENAIRRLTVEFEDLDSTLLVDESKVSRDSFGNMVSVELAWKDRFGDHSRNYGGCTGSDDSIENVDVAMSGLVVDDENPMKTHSNSGSGFGRDFNGNFVGDRDSNSPTVNYSSNLSDYEADNDPERHHW